MRAAVEERGGAAAGAAKERQRDVEDRARDRALVQVVAAAGGVPGVEDTGGGVAAGGLSIRHAEIFARPHAGCDFPRGVVSPSGGPACATSSRTARTGAGLRGACAAGESTPPPPC